MIESKTLRLLRFFSEKPWATRAPVCIYIFCMFVYPWFGGCFVWSHVQAVWDRWQTLNAGILAFVASVIALNITNFNEAKKRERQFTAARAFLPEALSELCGYCKESASVLVAAWERAESSNDASDEAPTPPEGYKEIFARCIESAEASFGAHLAKILSELQVHTARLDNLCGRRTSRIRTHHPQIVIKTYIYSIGIIQTLINRSFEVARGESEFDSSPLKLEEVMNAYRNLDITVSDIDDLEAFTARRFEQQRSTT